jgi:hypothetical protein
MDQDYCESIQLNAHFVLVCLVLSVETTKHAPVNLGVWPTFHDAAQAHGI